MLTVRMCIDIISTRRTTKLRIPSFARMVPLGIPSFASMVPLGILRRFARMAPFGIYIVRALFFSAVIITDRIAHGPAFYTFIFSIVTVQFWFHAWLVIRKTIPLIDKSNFMNYAACCLGVFFLGRCIAIPLVFSSVLISIIISAFEMQSCF